MPRPTVAPVALVTVRARRMRVFPMPVEICQGEVRELVLPELGWLTPEPIEDGVCVVDLRIADEAAPGPDLSEDLVMAELQAFEVPPPPPRPRHTPPPKISLKDVPSGMEQLAERWRGAP